MPYGFKASGARSCGNWGMHRCRDKITTTQEVQERPRPLYCSTTSPSPSLSLSPLSLGLPFSEVSIDRRKHVEAAELARCGFPRCKHLEPDTFTIFVEFGRRDPRHPKCYRNPPCLYLCSRPHPKPYSLVSIKHKCSS